MIKLSKRGVLLVAVSIVIAIAASSAMMALPGYQEKYDPYTRNVTSQSTHFVDVDSPGNPPPAFLRVMGVAQQLEPGSEVLMSSPKGDYYTDYTVVKSRVSIGWVGNDAARYDVWVHLKKKK